jgi:hypothetical protein
MGPVSSQRTAQQLTSGAPTTNPSNSHNSTGVVGEEEGGEATHQDRRFSSFQVTNAADTDLPIINIRSRALACSRLKCVGFILPSVFPLPLGFVFFYFPFPFSRSFCASVQWSSSLLMNQRLATELPLLCVPSVPAQLRPPLVFFERISLFQEGFF